MHVTLNGEPVQTDAATLDGLLGPLADGTAVAVDGEVVPRAAVAGHLLTGGETVEVVRAVAGG